MGDQKKQYDDLAATLFALVGQEDNVIVIHRAFVQFTGTLDAGILLSQLLYWTPRSTITLREADGTTSEGWIAKADDELAEELYLSKYALRQARAVLEGMHILETRVARFGGTPTLHYRLKLDELIAAWTAWCRKMDFSKSQSPFCETEKSLTEPTTEPTPETTYSGGFKTTSSSPPPPQRPLAKSAPPGNPAPRKVARKTDDGGGGGGGDGKKVLPDAVLQALQEIGYRQSPSALEEVAQTYEDDPNLVTGWLAEIRAHPGQYSNAAGFLRSTLRKRTPPPRGAQPVAVADCPLCGGSGWQIVDGRAVRCTCGDAPSPNSCNHPC